MRQAGLESEVPVGRYKSDVKCYVTAGLAF